MLNKYTHVKNWFPLSQELYNLEMMELKACFCEELRRMCITNPQSGHIPLPGKMTKQTSTLHRLILLAIGVTDVWGNLTYRIHCYGLTGQANEVHQADELTNERHYKWEIILLCLLPVFKVTTNQSSQVAHGQGGISL